MKILMLGCIFLMTGCTFADIGQRELADAKEVCSDHGGVYEVRVYTISEKSLVFCKDGHRGHTK